MSQEPIALPTIDIADMVALKYAVMERIHFPVTQPHLERVNNLIAQYWAIFNVPDSDARSLFRLIPWGEHPTRTSYQCCKYQLLVLIIRKILEFAEPGSNLVRQANACLLNLAGLISALTERDEPRALYRFFSFIGIIALIGSGLEGDFAVKNQDNEQFNASIYSGGLGLVGLLSFGAAFFIRKRSVAAQAEAEPFIARLQGLRLDPITSISLPVRFTDLVPDVDSDILRIIEWLRNPENQHPICSICECSEDELTNDVTPATEILIPIHEEEKSTVSSSTSASSSQQDTSKTSVIEISNSSSNSKPDASSAGNKTSTAETVSILDAKTPTTSSILINSSPQRVELYFMKAWDEKNNKIVFPGPYCASCITAQIQAGNLNDSLTRHKIILDNRRRPTLYPIGHILFQWKTIEEKYPRVFQPEPTPTPENKITPPITTEPGEKEENKLFPTIPAPTEQKKSAPSNVIRDESKSPKSTTKIPENSTLLTTPLVRFMPPPSRSFNIQADDAKFSNPLSSLNQSTSNRQPPPTQMPVVSGTSDDEPGLGGHYVRLGGSPGNPD